MVVEGKFIPDEAGKKEVSHGIAMPGRLEAYQIKSGGEEQIIIVRCNDDWSSTDVYAIDVNDTDPTEVLLEVDERYHAGVVTYEEPFVREAINKDGLKGRLVLKNIGCTPN